MGTEGEFLELESTAAAARSAAKEIGGGLPAGHQLGGILSP